MKKWIAWVLTVAMLLMGTIAVAEGTTDELDISADAAKVSELGVPTAASVAELKSKADALWAEGDWEKAADAYSEYAQEVNWLANLVAAGCEPFYGGTSDERSQFYTKTKNGFYSTVANGESRANNYKAERNRAKTYEALCYYKLGNYDMAVPLLTKALELIEIDQVEYWELCTNTLYDILGIN